MKKFSAALLALVVALLVGLPGALGGMAQNQLEAQLDIYDVNPIFELSIADYDRGWFRSHVRYEIGFTDEYLEMIRGAVKGDDNGTQNDPDQNDLDENVLALLAPFELISKISHGPVGLLDGPFFGLYKTTTAEGKNNPRLQEFLADARMPYLIKGTSTTSLLGNTAFSFEMPATATANLPPPSTASDSLASKLNFSGATASGNYAALTGEGGRIELASRIEKLSVEDDGSEFSMENLTFTTAQTLIAKMTGIGPLNISIGALTLRDQTRDEPVSMSAGNMHFDVISGYGDSTETLNVKASYRIGELTIDSQSVADIELGMTVSELSIDALQNYNEWTQNLAFVEVKDEAASEAMFADAVPFLHEFISKSPSISVDPIALTVGGEPFSGNLNINISGSSIPAIDGFDALDTTMWLQIVSGSAGLTLSESMATLLAVTGAQSQLQTALGDQQEISEEQISQMAIAQAPIMLQSLVQQGVLQAAEDQISASVSFANGELLLNGNPIPLETLLGM